MKKHVLLLTTLITVTNVLLARAKLSLVDSIAIKQADWAAHSFLNGKSFGMRFLIFRFGDKVVFINEIKTGYELYEGELNFNFKTQRQQLDSKKSFRLSNSPSLNRCFQQNICSPSKFFTASDPLNVKNINSDSKYIYLLVKNKNGVGCQFNVPIIYEKSGSDDIGGTIPLDRDALSYLMSFIR